MGKFSREKGKRGEREFSKLLRDSGIPARRGQQFKGGEGSPDIVSDLEGYHFEVKRVEKLNVENAMEQALAEKATGQKAVVAHRKNNKEWLVTMRAADFIDLVKPGG